MQDIATKIQHKYNTKTNKTTVKNWAEKPDINGETWSSINEKVKRFAIDKVKKETLSNDEKIVEAKGDDMAKIYKQFLNIFNAAAISFKREFDAGNISARDALTALKYSTDGIMRINEIPTEFERKDNISFKMTFIEDNE